MFNNIWKVAKEVAIAILLVLSLWLVINGALKQGNNSFQFGTLMDTIIALSNAIMAGAAIFAANEAKKWFQQKNKLNNLDSAHQKIKDYEDLLWLINNRIFKDTAIRANYKNDVQNKNIEIEILKNEVNSLLNSKTTTDLDDLSLIYSEQARLRRYGIKITQEFKDTINRIITKRSTYLDLHYEYLVYIFVTYKDPHQKEIPDRSIELDEAKIELAKEFELIMSNTPLDKHYDLSELN